MTDKMIPITSKDVKIINDINQVVKKSFLRYLVVRNGVVLTDNQGAVIENGIHFSFIEEIDKLMNLIEIPEGYGILFDSATVYKHFKDQKKFMKYLKIEGNNIFLSGEKEDCCIAKYIQLNDTIIENYKTTVDRIMKKEEQLLLDEDIERLLRNEVVTYHDKGYKVRLTKTVFPHIKVGLPITLTFFDVEEPNLFEVMISVTKDKVTNFHVYKCIKF